MKKGHSQLNFENEYNHIIEELKAGKRPRVRLRKDQSLQLSLECQELLETLEKGHIELTEFEKSANKYLCILTHIVNPLPYYDEFIINTLNLESLGAEFTVCCLAALQQVIIERYQKNGDKVPQEVIKCLSKSLKIGETEVTLWTLKIIQSLGRQSSALRPDVLSIKIGPFKFLNKNKQEAKAIVNQLKAQWEKIPSPR